MPKRHPPEFRRRVLELLRAGRRQEDDAEFRKDLDRRARLDPAEYRRPHNNTRRHLPDDARLTDSLQHLVAELRRD